MSPFQPMTREEIDRLENLLMKVEHENDHWITLSGADGFLGAIACSPEILPTDEWLATLVGEATESYGPEFLNEIRRLLERRLQEIIDTCRSDPIEFFPILEIDTDDSPLYEIWAEGFAVGMNLRPDSWAPLLVHPACSAMLMPMLALTDEKVLAEIEPRKRKWARLRVEMGDAIFDAIPALLAAVMVLRETGSLDDLPSLESMMAEVEEDVLQPAPAAAKVGRNDPCTCGSGKKFKKCCGAAA